MTSRWFLLLAAVILLWLGAACTKEARSAGSDPAAPSAMTVKIEVARPQPVGDFTEYLATLRSRNSALLKPQVEGQITRIYVQSGERVEEGRPLLQIDPLKQQATVRSQEATRQSRLAALEFNRAELERRKKLYAAGVISRQELEQAQTAYDASQAEVEALDAAVREQQVQLKYYTVNAPAAGTIGDIPVRVGDRVTTNTTLTTLDKTGELEAYISVPAEKSTQVRMGMPVELVDDDGKVTLRTKVTFISPRVDTESQLLLIKAEVPNPDHRFRNEQVVHARVVWRQLELPTIPVTAVSRLGGQMFAFVAEQQGANMVARQRAIRVGEVVGNRYVVLEGIKPGERMITTGVQVLADGAVVKPEG